MLELSPPIRRSSQPGLTRVLGVKSGRIREEGASSCRPGGRPGSQETWVQVRAPEHPLRLSSLACPVMLPGSSSKIKDGSPPASVFPPEKASRAREKEGKVKSGKVHLQGQESILPGNRSWGERKAGPQRVMLREGGLGSPFSHLFSRETRL